VFLIVAYLLSGALHEFLGMDVTSPGGKTVVTMSMTKSADASGKGMATEHHCHGCFSASLPSPILVSVVIESRAVTMPSPVSHNSDLSPGIDTPPPKVLA